jgi:hypothetical protein
MDDDLRLAVVIPVGPGDDAHDTVMSVLHYADPAALVLVDDSGGAVDLTSVAAQSPAVDLLPAPPDAEGNRGGLWVKLAAGYRRALELCPDLDVLLRLDADALIIGAGIAEAAADRFAGDPSLGLLGSYRIGPDGGARDFGPAMRVIRAEMGLRGRLRGRALRARLRERVAIAEANGYELGEHPLGGCFVHSGAAVRALSDQGLLELPELARSKASEDHLFALLTIGVGFRIGDFGGPDDPLAMRWQGLPAHPQELLARGKLVTHSVRSFGDLDERAIRSTFAAARGGLDPAARS